MEAKDNKSLWAFAFKDLQKANPELIEKFKYCIGVGSEADGLQNPESSTKDMVQNGLSKIDEVIISKEALNGKSDKIRKYFEQTIKLVISAKDFISAAVAANPSAAMAWTGICLVLPVSGRFKNHFDDTKKLYSYFSIRAKRTTLRLEG